MLWISKTGKLGGLLVYLEILLHCFGPNCWSFVAQYDVMFKVQSVKVRLVDSCCHALTFVVCSAVREQD